MDASKLMLRCIARKRGDQWEGLCLEFDLAAQGDTLEEVKKSLEEQIASYLDDALQGGTDHAHAGELLTRRAPLWAYAAFYGYQLLGHFSKLRCRIGCAFRESLPLKLAHP